MAIVQGLGNRCIKICQDLAGELVKGICTRSESYREAHIVVDTTYLKNARCEKPGQRSPEAAYRVCSNSTPVGSALKGFLSSVQTKHHLTTYLAEKLINPIDSSATTLVVSTSQDVSCLETKSLSFMQPIQLMMCNCPKGNCTKRKCSCKKNNLMCKNILKIAN